MLCYRHAPEPALGVCRYCGRGLCLQCVRDPATGMACSEECEQRLIRYDVMLINAETGYRTARRGNVVSALFPALLGALLLYFGLTEFSDFHAVAAMGALLIVFGAAIGWRQRSLARKWK